MSVDKATVQKLAHLARLEFSEEEQRKMATDLTKILDWVEKLEELNTEDVEPLRNLNEEETKLREDNADNFFKGEEALENAPEKDGRHYIVPKVLS